MRETSRAGFCFSVGNVLEIVRQSLARTLPPAQSTCLVVAVSGGPDSLALLLALNALADEMRLDLRVAHLDHGLRGDDSVADADFVRRTAAELGLPAKIGRADVGALAAATGRGIEETARQARYDFLARAAAEVGAFAVAAGHTADDQAETVLMHVVRGSGLDGLRGMRELTRLPTESSAELSSILVLRPLLNASRVQTEEYCRDAGIVPRHDASNESDTYRRNRIRARVMPLLASENPRVRDALCRLAGFAAEDVDLLESLADAAWGATVAQAGAGVALRLSAVAAQPAAIRSRLLRRAFVTVVGSARGLSGEHIAAARELVDRRSTGSSLDWPRGIRLTVTPELVNFTVGVPTRTALPEEPLPLAVPGATLLGSTGLRIVADLRASPCRWLPDDRNHADLDFDRCGPTLAVRRRRNGDRLVPLGSDHSKKLKDLLIDAKVPRHERNAVPVITAGDDIAWVAGVRLDNRFRVSDDTRTVVCLRVELDGDRAQAELEYAP